MSFKILVINPGSTSTKIGVYEDETLLFDKTLRHSAEDIAQFNSIPAQKDWRCQLVLKALREENFDINTLSAVSGRGGLLRPIRGGTYAVNDNLVNDCTIGVQGQHASNLGGIIAREIGDSLGIPSYIVDPVVVDELADVARYAGHPLFQRVSIFHALNQKAVAKRFAKEHGKNYEDLNLIVCHLGGGVSVGAHCHGSVIDTQNALDGDGPFSPERSGSLPTGQLVKLCEQVFQWKKPTTYTVLRKLCEKGLFQNVNGVVSSVMSREEFASRRSEQFVDNAFHGSLPAFVAAFTAQKPLSAQEAEEIQEMISKFRKGE